MSASTASRCAGGHQSFGWDSTLEPGPRAAERLHDLHRDMRGDIHTTHALRLGLREIKGISR